MSGQFVKLGVHTGLLGSPAERFNTMVESNFRCGMDFVFPEDGLCVHIVAAAETDCRV
jgi:hypothetical protein